MIVSTGLTVPVAVAVRVIVPRVAVTVTYCTDAVRCILHHANPATATRISNAMTIQQLWIPIWLHENFAAVDRGETCSKGPSLRKVPPVSRNFPLHSFIP